MLEEVFLSPLFSIEGVEVAALNLIIFAAIIILGIISVRQLKVFLRKQELNKKKFAFEGINIPVFRLIIQLFWVLLLYVAIKSLRINNQDYNFEVFLDYEFIRFDDFYIAVFHIFFAIGIYMSGRIILTVVRIYLISRLKKITRADEGTGYVYFQIIKYVLICLGIILLMRSMGVVLSTFMEAFLFLSVGVALGMQDIFKDFFSGFLLLFEGSVKVGDLIEIENLKADQQNFVARILDINMRTSKVETRDGKILIIPNSHLTFQKVNNWTTGNLETRFMIPVVVHYGVDIEKVREILIECAKAHPKVNQNREAIVRLLNFGANGYELDLVFWANKNFFIEIHKSDIRFAIDKAFKEHGITYPYPQMDLHFKNQSKPDQPNSDSAI